MSSQKNYNGNIFFVGDSFCDAYDDKLWKDLGCTQWQNPTSSHKSYLSLVSNHFNYQLHPHGYGGKSWWYSRDRFLADLNRASTSPHFNLRAVIFFHTDHARLNNAYMEYPNTPNRVDLEDFYKKYYDDEFQRWAQIQWFQELAREYKNIKTLHFSCFDIPHDTMKILPGMVFVTPMIHISLGELTGTDQEVLLKSSYQESRANHLSAKNNQILAEMIIESLENYRPGYYELDLNRFDRVNKNAGRWPEPGFGTE